jgi:hypothetical protein
MIDWSDIPKLYEQGLSCEKIGKIKGCHGVTINNHLRIMNVPIKPRSFYRRELANNFKGGRYHIQSGYVTVLSNDHPYADKVHRVYEHRLVMEKMLGRYLLPTEVVHHKNGIRDDNRPENLELCSQRENVVLQRICANCELRKEIRLLRLQVKMLMETNQIKMQEDLCQTKN